MFTEITIEKLLSPRTDNSHHVGLPVRILKMMTSAPMSLYTDMHTYVSVIIPNMGLRVEEEGSGSHMNTYLFSSGSQI